MKQVKKLLVVLPLVLVFVLGSLPVFAKWPEAGSTIEFSVEIKLDGTTLTETFDVQGKEILPETDFSELGAPSLKKLSDYILSKSTFKDDFKSGKVKIKDITEDLTAHLADTGTDFATGKSFNITLEKVEEAKPNLLRIAAIDRLTLGHVRTEIYELENKNNAKSVYDMAHEFFDWETKVSGTLKDYYFLGFAPDVNNATTDLEDEVMADYGLDILVWVVEKLQPLTVTHVFPDRAPLLEKIAVDYWVLEKGQINNANAAEFAKTRIQKMNEQGYVFEKAEYTPYIYRESIMKEARDVYGKKISVDTVVSTHGIFVYYKGAVVPAPVPDSEKKVDAATAQTGVQANVQAPVAAAGAQPQQLPATGVADNAFLFLSSAALMALGIFFFKKH